MFRFPIRRHRAPEPVTESAGNQATQSEAQATPDARAFGVSRIAGFSDGVFSIAITLLVFGLQVPDIANPTSAEELAESLGALAPQFEAYAQTFLIIGAFWVGHHRAFRRIARDNDRLVWINLLFLLTVSFMPFPAMLVGRYPDNRVSVLVMSGSLAAVSLTYAGLWAYGRYGGLFVPFTAPIVRIELWTAGTMAALFLISIPVAFADLDLARLCGNFVLVVLVLSNRAYRKLARGA